jgi:hypothetical protein
MILLIIKGENMDSNEKKAKVAQHCNEIIELINREIDNPNSPYHDYFPFELIYMVVATTYENALLKQLATKFPAQQQAPGLQLVPNNNDNIPTSDPGPIFPFENVPVTQIRDDFEDLNEFEGKGKILHFRPKNNISN